MRSAALEGRSAAAGRPSSASCLRSPLGTPGHTDTSLGRGRLAAEAGTRGGGGGGGGGSGGGRETADTDRSAALKWSPLSATQATFVIQVNNY